MRNATLREVLLLKALEETDPAGASLPLAVRETATREALRDSAGTGPLTGSAAQEAFLSGRAKRLFPPLAERYPLLDSVASRADLPWWLTTLVLALAFVSGFGLAALDGSKRVDILAVPFLGLVLWNLVVYVGSLLAWLRRALRPSSDRETSAGDYWLRHHVAPRLGRLMVRAPGGGGTDLPADALARFAADFGRAAAELLAAHAKRLLHLGAAAVALGLVAGIYLRGTVLQYLAGWESTFLGPGQVRLLIGALYAPAASLLGFALPGTSPEVEALAWTRGGVPAAPWLHLIAVTVVLFVVMPRLLLAGWAQLRSLRFAQHATLPPSLVEYAQQLAGGVGIGGAPSIATPERTVDLSLISHTNVGKTTLARTLLHRDVGEVRDAEHVTTEATAYELLATSDGDLLQLWDTPGFADSARLAARLEQGGAIGWFLSQVWDRLTDRAFFLSQRALANVRERADLVLYLVDARAEPGTLDYLDAEMRILGWLGKPVLVLLNQLGEPRPVEEERTEIDRWTAQLSRYAWVKGTLPFDAFARCWVQEQVLIERIGVALPSDLQSAWSRLGVAWRQRNREAFESSAGVLARQLALIAADGEIVPTRGVAALARDWLVGLGGEERRPIDRAMRSLADRAASGLNTGTGELLALHGLSGNVAEQIDARVTGHYAIEVATDPGKAGLLGGAISGALGGLAADLAAGGLTLGAGALIGAILGAAGGTGLARAYNLSRGGDRSTVRWSSELLTTLTSAAVLRYLAVAHYGRGRGDYVASEYPSHWRSVVDSAIAARRSELELLWASAATDFTAAALEPRLRVTLQALLEDVLERLYPPESAAGH